AWQFEKENWLRCHPEPWDAGTEDAYYQLFSGRIDAWLDQGSGSCVLQDPLHGNTVAQALRHFDHQRYLMASFVVMPNHVHALFRPLEPYGLAKIVQSWKGFTAREINKRRGKVGSLWQDEYWDRLIRSEAHFMKVKDYIRNNPVVAKLRQGQYVYWESDR
ncbi:transposase, partial [Arthrospira platensis SPKY1]|nr:transposase [Arthrospira platensis SPKY1]